MALNDTEPLLAAVVITRNEERWIETCLWSVIARQIDCRVPPRAIARGACEAQLG